MLTLRTRTVISNSLYLLSGLIDSWMLSWKIINREMITVGISVVVGFMATYWVGAVDMQLHFPQHQELPLPYFSVGSGRQLLEHPPHHNHL